MGCYGIIIRRVIVFVATQALFKSLFVLGHLRVPLLLHLLDVFVLAALVERFFDLVGLAVHSLDYLADLAANLADLGLRQTTNFITWIILLDKKKLLIIFPLACDPLL